MGKKKYDPLWKIVGENVALQGAEPDYDARCPYCHVVVHVGPKGKVGERYECGLCGGVSVLAEEEDALTPDRLEAKLGRSEMSIHSGWLSCPECRVVSQDSDLSRLHVPCPTCGTSGQARTIWPSMPAQSLLGHALEHELNDQESRATAIVSANTLLEILLEDAVRDLLEREGASSELSARIVGEAEAVDGRLEIVKQLLGTTVGDVAAELGMSWFMDDWDQLRRMRSDAVHQGNLYSFPSDLHQRLERITHAGVQIFAEVHNRTWMAAKNGDLGPPSVFLHVLVPESGPSGSPR